MAHSHGDEYQVKIVHEDGTEELSGWMNSEGQVAQAMLGAKVTPVGDISRARFDIASEDVVETPTAAYPEWPAQASLVDSW
jgi:hypothetical protein